jgi:SAM-dependent methyltransferase
VHETVQDFYERYPYPPPVENLDRYRSLWADGRRRREEHHLYWPGEPYRENHSILVAGCGTSQAAKYAVRWPNARVTAIDFSATSVRCTETLKRRNNLENLDVHQLPVERVAELRTRFDHVVSTGVLHHLPDPLVGLRALREVLEPRGAMLLMLYAPYGRAGIYLIQEFCRRVGIAPNADGLRDLVALLGALPPGHPLERLLRDAPDFRTEAALADALLHPQDRAFSVPQVFDFLKAGGLIFGRWARQAPYSARCGSVTRVLQAARIAHLPAPEEFAAVELFRGTLLRHSLIAFRDDAGDEALVPSFDGDAHVQYVPMRTSDTIAITDRLPGNTAAVLINRHHDCRDIALALDHDEKRWFDTIDGARCIGDIGATDGLHAKRRAFFERLWWHDQVVFDTTRANG